VQVSVLVVRQVAQTAPEVPHCVSLVTWQTPLKQHPVGQLLALHPVQVPPSQVLPEGHAWQD
jgi:hypothetical protein